MLALPASPAFASFSTSPRLPVSESAESASQLADRGRERYRQGRYAEAIAVWQQAAQAYERQGNSALQAATLSFLSLAYQQQGLWSEAEGAIATALTLLGEGAESLSVRAKVLNARGRLELTLGQAEMALATWQQATELYERADDELGAMGGKINQAQALEAMGLHRRTCKTLLEALEATESCDLTGKEGKRRFTAVLQAFESQADPKIREIGLRSLGNLLRSLGELDRSRQVFQQSLTASAASAERSLTLIDAGKTEQAIYNRSRDLFERTNIPTDRDRAWQGAKEAFEKAHTAYQQATQQANTDLIVVRGQLHRLSLLVDAQVWLRELAAERHFAEPQAISAQIERQVSQLKSGSLANLPASQAAVYAQLNFAQSLLRLPSKNSQKARLALKYAEMAEARSQQLKDKRSQSYAFGTLGEVYEKLQRLSEARSFTERAIAAAQAGQAAEIAYRWQWQLGRVLKQQGENAKAVGAYEIAVKTLESVRGDLLTTHADVQFTFRDNIEPIYRELVDLLLSSSNPSQENLEKSLYYIESLQLAELENFLRCNLQATGALKVNPNAQKAPIEVLIARLNQVVRDDPTVALIYPIILENRVAVLAKLPQEEGLRYYFSPQSQSEVESAIAALLDELKEDHATQEGRARSAQVYDWLIRPVEAQLQGQGVKTLAFVLDGTLGSVPMAALYDRQTQQYLLEKEYGTILAPSLQLLDPKPLERENLSVLGAGVSQGQTIDGQAYEPLNNVVKELKQVEETTAGQILLDDKFTRSNLRDHLSSSPFSVVHIATHGKFSSDPEDTFIIAWQQRLKVADLDNLLRGSDRRNAREIELLILTACETARGDRRATLGIAGVAVRAGARSTLASLWRANDELSVTLIEAFYQQLLENPDLTKTEALRRAQLQLLKKPASAPYEWAPFILVGNWQ